MLLQVLEKVKHRVVTMHASDRYLAEGTLEDLRQEEDSVRRGPVRRDRTNMPTPTPTNTAPLATLTTIARTLSSDQNVPTSTSVPSTVKKKPSILSEAASRWPWLVESTSSGSGDGSGTGSGGDSGSRSGSRSGIVDSPFSNTSGYLPSSK